MADDLTLPASGSVINTTDTGSNKHDQHVRIGGQQVHEGTTDQTKTAGLAAVGGYNADRNALIVNPRPLGEYGHGSVLGQTARTYSAGQCLGTLTECPYGDTNPLDTSAVYAHIINFSAVCRTNSATPDLDIWIYGTSLSHTATDGSAFGLTDSQVSGKHQALIQVREVDWVKLGSANAVAALGNVDIWIPLSAISGKFWYQVVAQSTYVSGGYGELVMQWAWELV